MSRQSPTAPPMGWAMGDLWIWIAIAAVTALVLVLPAVALLSRGSRHRRLLATAMQARQLREFQSALKRFEELGERTEQGGREDQATLRFRFAALVGQADCHASMGHPDESAALFARAQELLKRTEQPATAEISVHGGLALARLAQGQDASEPLAALRRVCEQIEGEQERADAAHILLFSVALQAASQCEYGLAMKLAGQAAEMVAGTEPWQTGQLAHMRSTAAELCLLTGDYAKADEIARGELNEIEDLEVRDSLTWIRAHLDMLAGRFDEGRRRFQECIELRASMHGDEHLRTALGRGGLSLLDRSRGAYRSALHVRRQVHESLDEMLEADDPILVDSGLMLGLLLSHAGHFAEARPLVADAVEAARQRNDQQLQLAQAKLFQAVCLLDEEWDEEGSAEAERAAAEAHQLAESVYGQGNRMTGEYLLLHGIASTRSDPDAAAELLERAAAAHEPIRDFNRITTAELLAAQAEVKRLQGDLPAAAQQCEEAWDLLAPLVDPSHTSLAGIRRTHGQALLALDRRDEAVQALRQALDIRRMSQPSDHPRCRELQKLLEHA